MEKLTGKEDICLLLALGRNLRPIAQIVFMPLKHCGQLENPSQFTVLTVWLTST